MSYSINQQRLSMIIDRILNFEEHVIDLCKKIFAPAKIYSRQNFGQRKLILNLFMTKRILY